MKYDDLTLIKFVDNELEDSLMSEIKKEMLVNKDLANRLKVVSLISNDKIIRAQKYGQILLQESHGETESKDLHESIKALIDNFEPTPRGRLLILLNQIKTKYKLRTAFISSVILVLISLNMTPHVMTRGVDFLDNSSASVTISNSSDSTLV